SAKRETVAAAGVRAASQTAVAVADPARLFVDVPGEIRVWASHGDLVASAPAGFSVVATSANAPIAAMSDPRRGLYAILFHPEVVHTERGLEILRNFAFGICGCTGDWTMAAFVDEATARIRRQVGSGRIVCALSGGVDSTVAALILHRAVSEQLTCIFVDNGLLRLNEASQIRKRFERLHLPVVFVDASTLFLDRLTGIVDPETKRKIIGATFIDVFETEAAKLGQVDFLAQGTLYPDVIESVAIVGQSAVIKSHHNVGGLPARSGGVMGDERTYECTAAIRAVESRDGMTADWARLPHDLLARVSSRIVNEVKGINRIVYDISSKPPSTIEWE